MVGRPGHEPTPQTRETVRRLRSAGTLPEDIAPLLKMSERSLWRHYKDELTEGFLGLRDELLALAVTRCKGTDLQGIPVPGMGIHAIEDKGAAAYFNTLAQRLLWNPLVVDQRRSKHAPTYEESVEDQAHMRTHRALQEMLSLARRAGQGDLARIIQDRLLEPVHNQEASGNGSERDEGAGE